MKLSTFSSFLAIVFLAVLPATALASQQEHVDYIVKRIDRTLQKSLQNPDGWRNDYKVVGWNIEDLRKTLEQGGRLTSNPVRTYQQRLQVMLQERRAAWDSMSQALKKLQHQRRTASKQQIRDTVMELIIRLRPRPGILDPFAIALSKNMKVIEKDNRRVKKVDKLIRLIEDERKSIRPAIHDMRNRYRALAPLVEAYSQLPGANATKIAVPKRTSAPQRAKSQAGKAAAKPKGGHWTMVNKIVWVDPHINDHECYVTSLSLSAGAFTLSESKPKCSKPYWRYSVTGNWSNPPQYLEPGRKYPMTAALTGHFTISGNGYLNIYMDDATTKCGGASSAKDITGALRIRWNGEKSVRWKGVLSAPGSGYGNDHEQFQIKATTADGCVRYIYQWEK